jgi:tetratricopeptide (TPR) repeat protein
VRLSDLRGALQTLRRVPGADRPEVPDFVASLAALQAARGDTAGALKTVSDVPWGRRDLDHCRALLAVARSAGRAGHPADAAQAAGRAAEVAAGTAEDIYRHIALYDVGMAQVAIGATDAARATHRELAALTARIGGDQSRARSLCRMGRLSAKLARADEAARYFAEALLAIDVRSLGGASAYEAVAVAQAESGDIPGAVRTARAIPETFPLSADRDKALYGIALVQLARGDLAGSADTAGQIRHFLQYHSAALIAIAEGHARAGEEAQALTSAGGITNDSRRAQAVLAVAAVLAQRGDAAAARKLAEGLAYPRVRDELLAAPGRGQQFVFRDHTTWGTLYESGTSFTMTSYHVAKETADDLTAAAMLCRVALGGRAASRKSRTGGTSARSAGPRRRAATPGAPWPGCSACRRRSR